MGVKWTVTLASYTPHPISIALPPVPSTTSLTSFGMCMEGTVGTRQKRWRCEGVVEHYHKDNLRHLPRFPGFFVTFRILVTLPHPSITPAHIPLSFTSRLEVNEVNGNETGVGEGMENEGVDNRHVTSRSFASHSFHSIIVHTRSPSRHSTRHSLGSLRVIGRDIAFHSFFSLISFFYCPHQTVTPCLANERRGNSRVLYDNVTQKLYGKDWVIRILTTYLLPSHVDPVCWD